MITIRISGDSPRKFHETRGKYLVNRPSFYLGTIEGFGLPALEAMSSGCLVVGFSNYGGQEYATDKNGLWCRQGDLLQAARRLDEACKIIVRKGEQNYLQQGRKTAMRYSPELSRAALTSFWGAIGNT
ncbi:glycosyltransferase [Desulfonatronum parangueonense]